MQTLCKEIVVFLIIAKILEGFQAGKKYEKFLKLILSLIVVLKLITPIFSLFGNEFDLYEITQQMEKRLAIEGENQELIEEETEVIENIEISNVHLKVEEIQWEK